MHRHHCMSWFEKNYPDRVLAKSACIGCPFHNDALWRDLKQSMTLRPLMMPWILTVR